MKWRWPLNGEESQQKGERREKGQPGKRRATDSAEKGEEPLTGSLQVLMAITPSSLDVPFTQKLIKVIHLSKFLWSDPTCMKKPSPFFLLPTRFADPSVLSSTFSCFHGKLIQLILCFQIHIKTSAYFLASMNCGMNVNQARTHLVCWEYRSPSMVAMATSFQHFSHSIYLF